MKLETKLIDAVEYVSTILNVTIVNEYKNICKKMANTRNLYSHFYKMNKTQEYLTEKEMNKFNPAIRTIFRILFFVDIGIDEKKVAENMLRNGYMTSWLSILYSI